MNLQEAKKTLESLLEDFSTQLPDNDIDALQYFIELASRIKDVGAIKKIVRDVGAPHGMPLELSIMITAAIVKYLEEG